MADDVQTRGKAAPSTAPVAARHKVAGHVALLRDYLGRRREPIDFDGLFADIEEYDELSRRYTGRPLSDSRLLEIGYGARPYRLIALQSIGVDAFGIDMEFPVLRGRVEEFREVWRRNGAERFAKTLARSVLYDRRARRELAAALRRHGHAPRADPARFLVGDATKLELPTGSIDLVTSEDVFEHIPAATLPRLVENMARWLRPVGLALIRPDVFTGITGGHVVEWNLRSFERGHDGRRTDPWAHLRGTRPPVNTHLNELTRAQYRELFRTHFEVLEETADDPELGREYLTPDVRAELSHFDEDELFSNQVLFVLRPQLDGASVL
jgi:Methyltransferase domain